MLYIFLGMGICIVFYIVAFAFARAAARADAYREHDAAPPCPVDDTASPTIAFPSVPKVPHHSVEVSNDRASRTGE